MTEALETLRLCRSVLIIDWPSPDVPDSLARAGYTVFVKGGPGPRDYTARELRDGEVLTRATGEPPTQVDLVYSHRPLGELEGIVAMARELGALAVWCQSGLAGPETKDPKGTWVSPEPSAQARALVEAAGLRYVDNAYIGDVAREFGSDAGGG